MSSHSFISPTRPMGGRIAPVPARRRAWPWPVSTLLLWQDRARMRSHLATLPSHLLRDVGLSDAERQREASKPVWRA